MKKNRIKITSLLMTMLILSTISVSTASVYVSGHSAVDNMEIRYGGSTKYTSAQGYSFDTWNGLGEVNIAPDTIFTIEDLEYADYYDEDGAVGYYQPVSWGADKIRFNEYYCDEYSSTNMKNVALHELGHALGLDHSPLPNVMYAHVAGTTELGSDDIDSYNYLYA